MTPLRMAFWVLMVLLTSPHPAWADTLDDIRRTGELTWGADPEGGAPYVFPDPDQPDRFIGFEADLAAALARGLNVRPRLIPTDWTSLIPALERRNFDIAMNGIEWTRERAGRVLFTRPYYIYTQQLVTRSGHTGIRDIRDVPGHTVATLSGSVAESLLLKIPGVSIKHYEGQVEPYRDLALGRLDAVFMDLPIAHWYAAPNPKLELTGQPLAEGLYAMALRPQDTRLKQELDRILEDLLASGELQRIYQKWNLWNEAQLSLAHPTTAARQVQSGNVSNGLGNYLALLLKGAGMTVLLSVVSMALAVLVGAALCAMRLNGGPIKSFAILYIEILRGTPLLLQLYILYYGLPNIGIRLDAFTAAVLGLGLNYAAYEAEIYRAGLASIPKGQTDAALSLGMTPALLYRRVLIPQTVRVVLPPSTNDFISLFKDSSLVSIIAIVELTKTYNMLAVSSMKFLELGLLTALLYLMMSLPLSWLSGRLERRAA